MSTDFVRRRGSGSLPSLPPFLPPFLPPPFLPSFPPSLPPSSQSRWGSKHRGHRRARSSSLRRVQGPGHPVDRARGKDCGPRRGEGIRREGRTAERGEQGVCARERRLNTDRRACNRRTEKKRSACISLNSSHDTNREGARLKGGGETMMRREGREGGIKKARTVR